ncbi:MAG: CoA-binding protein [Burkholderiales bacterium]|nr:CoA-binding protein [Burkholderiales bacterium]
MFANPPDAEIRACLARVKTVAVVGLSPRADRPSHRIARRLQQWGYRVVPVRPAVREVLGEKAYARLADVPGRIDLVDVFRAARAIGPIVEQCIALGISAIWIQEGIVDEAAAERARDAGLFVVMNRCIAVEYRRLMSPVQA